MQNRKVPLRMCSGCSEMKPKRELVRVVKSPQGDISIDLTGRKSGRGAYICKNSDCLVKAKKTKRFERSFSMQIPDEIYDNLYKELENGN